MDMNMASVLKTGRAGGEEWSQQGITTPLFFLFFFSFWYGTDNNGGYGSFLCFIHKRNCVQRRAFSGNLGRTWRFKGTCILRNKGWRDGMHLRFCSFFKT